MGKKDDENSQSKPKRRKKMSVKSEQGSSKTENGKGVPNSAVEQSKKQKKKRRKKSIRLSDARLKAYGLNPDKVKYTHPHLKKFKTK